MNLIDYNKAMEALENERRLLLNREQYLKGYADRDSEIVRCKDCRKNMTCKLTIGKPKDWFCADGKRKSAEEEP